MIPSENGSVFGEIWYVTFQKSSKNSPHICDCISVCPQASEKVPGHQIKYIQTLKEANHYMLATGCSTEDIPYSTAFRKWPSSVSQSFSDGRMRSSTSSSLLLGGSEENQDEASRKYFLLILPGCGGTQIERQFATVHLAEVLFEGIVEELKS
jgi:hypothetical protein